jgi:predicted GIY-YIG superfamily endonuclease
MATVYLLHFSMPLHHARHYLGMTKGDLAKRVARHRRGAGANITKVAVRTGIRLLLVMAWHDAPRSFETKLKRAGSGARYCPYCHGLAALNRGRLPEN